MRREIRPEEMKGVRMPPPIALSLRFGGEEEPKRKAKFERKRGGKRRRKKHNQMCHHMARRQWQQCADRNEAAMLTKK